MLRASIAPSKRRRLNPMPLTFSDQDIVQPAQLTDGPRALVSFTSARPLQAEKKANRISPANSATNGRTATSRG
jgi:hypothetical protein